LAICVEWDEAAKMTSPFSRNFIFVLLLLFHLPDAAASAQTFVVQGSSTFAQDVMAPYQKAIEASSGHKLTVVPNKSSIGLLALFEQRTNFSMISGPLENQVKQLKFNHPALPFERLQVFKVSQTYMTFAVNRQNPIYAITDNNMRDILLGKISNWHDVDGPDLSIKIVQVRGGGGVPASVEAALLNGNKISVQNPISVTTSAQVVKVVEQLPEALGLAQRKIVMQSNVRELKIDHPVVQELSLVTLGEPTPEMRKVIDATRSIASTAMRSETPLTVR
jgi:phosphate transport system substrate-binding protein